jgi:crotonobetainyl-CoA:carnitine CoA-transferase CaiB-like acyl-CoA transferase
VGTPTGRDLFAHLVHRADFVIESFDSGVLDGLGVGSAWMRALNPRVIVTSMSAFGQGGPRRRERASELEVLAASGFLALTGEPGREPVRISLAQSPMWAGLHAAMGTLVAHYARRRLGIGQHVDVSAQASRIAAVGHAPAFGALSAQIPERSGAYVTGRTVTGGVCAPSGPAATATSPSRSTAARRDGAPWPLCAPGCAVEHGTGPLAERDWATSDVASLAQDEVDALEAPIAAFFTRLSKQEYYAGVLERGMLGYPVSTAADMLADPHLAARAAWTPVEADGWHGGAAQVERSAAADGGRAGGRRVAAVQLRPLHRRSRAHPLPRAAHRRAQPGHLWRRAGDG